VLSCVNNTTKEEEGSGPSAILPSLVDAPFMKEESPTQHILPRREQRYLSPSFGKSSSLGG